MNLITCWSCGVILNKDALNFPPVFHGNDDYIKGNSVWDCDSFVRIVACPVCSESVREDGVNS